MGKHASSGQDAMVSRLFFKLLPIQVAVVAMGSINAIVDGFVAARFINPASVGVIGLYYTMLRVLEAAGGILLGGVSVHERALPGRRKDEGNARGLFPWSYGFPDHRGGFDPVYTRRRNYLENGYLGSASYMQAH